MKAKILFISTFAVFWRNTMGQYLRHVLMCILGFFIFSSAGAQPWPNAELEKKYQQAKGYLSTGDLQNAISSYQQIIPFAPDKMILYKELGKAYYLNKNYKEADKPLSTFLKSKDADEEGYQLKSASLFERGKQKKAKKVLSKGLEAFALSGLLYHEMGRQYESQNKPAQALQSWVMGIRNDQAYAINYYEAARLYMKTWKPVWAIIYAEMYLHMDHESAKADEMKKVFIDAYKKFFTTDTNHQYRLYELGNYDEAPFEEAVEITLLKNIPLANTGLNTETLTMIRTRFVVAWAYTFGETHPFTLFTYHDELLRNGLFDAYNQWLIGKTDNPQEFEQWKMFHEGAISNYENFNAMRNYQPKQSEFYNNSNMEALFGK